MATRKRKTASKATGKAKLPERGRGKRYSVVSCAGSAPPKVRSFNTLSEARKAAKKSGVIRDKKTGHYVNKTAGKPRESPPPKKRAPKKAPASPGKTEAPTVRNITAKDKIGGLVGRRTTVLTTDAACLKHEPARFRLVSVSRLIPSHDGQTFKVNAAYPKGVQERRYDTSKSEQSKVIRNAQASCFEPSILANTDPTPLGGSPIVSPAGIVLGGNSRAMVLQRVYAQDGSAAKEYRALLRANAGDWGFDRRDVAKFQNPALVRVVGKSVSKAAAVRRYNESLTQSLDVTTEQVAVSARINPAIIGELKKMDEGDTLEKFLKSPRSKGLVILLQRRRVITKQQVPKYIKRGLLNEDGRRFFARALVGRILPDAKALDLLFNATPSLRPNLARAVPFILLAADVKPMWNIGNAMPDAARIYSAVKSGGHPSVDAYLKQSALFSSGLNVTSASALLARILLKHNGQIKLQAGFRRYADAAERSRTKDLFGAPPPPVQALATAFGVKVPTGPAVLEVTSFSPSAVATARRNGNGKRRKGAR